MLWEPWESPAVGSVAPARWHEALQQGLRPGELMDMDQQSLRQCRVWGRPPARYLMASSRRLSPHPAGKVPRQIKQGRCGADALQAGRGAGLAGCHPIPSHPAPSHPSCCPRAASPRLVPATPCYSRWAPGRCEAGFCVYAALFALVINANCRGFIDQLGEVLPVFSGEMLNANRAEI